MERTIEDLRDEMVSYIKEQAKNIYDDMVTRGVFTSKLATCDHYNWDRKLHRSMTEIVIELKSRGITTTSSVNWGVTDWVFTLKV